MKKKQRNSFEKRIHRSLKRVSGIKVEYETEKIPYYIEGNYIPDFIITTSNGKIYLETKGYLRVEAKRKMVAVRRQHPELDIRILFYSHKAKDIKWAEKYGFKWAVDKVPKDWLQ